MIRFGSFLAPSVALLCLLGAGCGDALDVTFSVGCIDCADPPILFELQANTELSLPAELREDSGATPVLRELPCAMGMCPSDPGGAVEVSCVADVCNPDPVTVEVPVGDVVDFSEASSELEGLVGSISSIEIVEASYGVLTNTLTVDVGRLELYWAPASASAIDGSARLFGEVPPLAAGATRRDTVILDDAGQQALSDHLLNDGRARFFASTEADVEPGDPWPEGQLRVAVELRIRASGSPI